MCVCVCVCERECLGVCVCVCVCVYFPTYLREDLGVVTHSLTGDLSGKWGHFSGPLFVMSYIRLKSSEKASGEVFSILIKRGPGCVCVFKVIPSSAPVGWSRNCKGCFTHVVHTLLLSLNGPTLRESETLEEI